MASEPSLVSSSFFVLEQYGASTRHDADVEKVDPVNRESAPRCAGCGDIIGMKIWLPPFKVELVLFGEELGDLLKTGYDLLLSERLAHAFVEEGLTGLKGFHPVDVVRVRRGRSGPKPPAAPRYVVATPCFARAVVDLPRSRIEYSKTPTCDDCRNEGPRAIHGYTLDVASWKGEDVFRPRGLQGVLTVSERFARMVKAHGFTNMRLTPTEEFVWNPYGPDPLPTTKEGSA